MIIGIHGAIHPLKSKMKNFQEMLYLNNLQILYAIALYNHQKISVVAFDLLVGLTAVHFAFISIYYTITYACINTIKTKIHSRIIKLSEWITNSMFLHMSHKQQQ